MRSDMIKVLYKQHAVQHQEPSSFIASLRATPPRALPRPPPPTMCTKDAPLRNDVPVHDFLIRAPVAYTRGARRTRYPPISGRVS
ncbi:hypothetical protein M405DRAFT_831456, partial [Rhizopogon salebrosus TDB-379]